MTDNEPTTEEMILNNLTAIHAQAEAMLKLAKMDTDYSRPISNRSKAAIITSIFRIRQMTHNIEQLMALDMNAMTRR